MKKIIVLWVLFFTTLLLSGCSFLDDSNTDVTPKGPIGTYNEDLVSGLLGSWVGTYVAGQGKTGLLLKIKSIDANGIIDADYIFHYDTIKGSYKTRGVIDFNQNIIKFSGVSWYLQPKNFVFLTFEVAIDSSNTKLSSDSTNYQMNLTKRTANELDKDSLVNQLKGNWEGTYIANQGLTNALLHIDSVDIETGDVIAVFRFNKDGLTGVYSLTGTFNFETHTLIIEGIEWHDRPNNYVMLDFFLIVDFINARMVGDDMNYKLTITKVVA